MYSHLSPGAFGLVTKLLPLRMCHAFVLSAIHFAVDSQILKNLDLIAVSIGTLIFLRLRRFANLVMK
jgi:hypothetical protein